MPLLPEEMNGAYYANARLNTSVCSVRIWTNSYIRWRTYCSRVLEKSSAYAFSILQDVLAHLELEKISKICIWSDGGPSFKSYMTLGTIAKTLVHQYRRTFEVNFGCEMEFKNECDRYFGKLDSLLEMARCDTPILDIQDVVAACQSHLIREAALYADAAQPNVVREEFIEWMPPAKATMPMSKLKAATCPVKLQHCYYWPFADYVL